MDDVLSQIKYINRTASPAIVRTVAANVVPLYRLKNAGARAYICRLPEPTLAHSREQHVQAPEAAKTRQKSNPIVQHLKVKHYDSD